MPRNPLAQLDRLGEFIDSFACCFDRKDRAKVGATYVRGVLGDARRKNMQGMWERLAEPVDYQAIQSGLKPECITSGAGYGDSSEFRAEIRKRDLHYSVGVQGQLEVFVKPPSFVKRKAEKMGRPPKRLRLSANSPRPRVIRDVVEAIPDEEWTEVTWRTGTKDDLKAELGLDHFEGRSYPGLHRHLALTAMAYYFLEPRARKIMLHRRRGCSLARLRASKRRAALDLSAASTVAFARSPRRFAPLGVATERRRRAAERARAGAAACGCTS